MDWDLKDGFSLKKKTEEKGDGIIREMESWENKKNRKDGITIHERERERDMESGVKKRIQGLGFGWMDVVWKVLEAMRERGREGGTWDEMKEKKNQPSYKMLH